MGAEDQPRIERMTRIKSDGTEGNQASKECDLDLPCNSFVSLVAFCSICRIRSIRGFLPPSAASAKSAVPSLVAALPRWVSSVAPSLIRGIREIRGSSLFGGGHAGPKPVDG